MLRSLFWKFLDRIADAIDGLWTSFVRSGGWIRETATDLRAALNRVRERPERRRDLSARARLVVKYVPAGVVFLAFAILLVWADAPDANWTYWLPVPLGFVVLVGSVIDSRSNFSGGTLLLGAILVAGWMAGRTAVALAGPLPYEALRDVQLVFAAFSAGVAAWMLAGRRARRAWVAWVAALSLALLVRALLPGGLLSRSDMVPLALSLAWALAGLGGQIARDRRDAALAKPLAPPPPGGALLRAVTLQGHVLALAFGAGLGLLLSRRPDLRDAIGAAAPDLASASAVERGSEALEILWTRSLLFGWGSHPLPRLAVPVASPASVALPEWSGPYGPLAAFGIVGALVAGWLSLGLIRMSLRRARLGMRPGEGPQLSLLAAQSLLAAIFVGGPRSALPFVLLAAWLSLGVARTAGLRAAQRASSGHTVWRALCATPVCLAVFAGLVVATGPVWARSYVKGLELEDFTDEDGAWRLSRRLDLARTLSPYDPKVELAEGLRLRESLQRDLKSGWNEPIFVRMCDAYRRAMELDPYDDAIPLRLAAMQTEAKRPREALETIRRGLATSPSSEPLLRAMFAQARERRDVELADEALERALAVAPHAAFWWTRRYEFDHAMGRGPSAGRALQLALTADPDAESPIAGAALERERAMNP